MNRYSERLLAVSGEVGLVQIEHILFGNKTIHGFYQGAWENKPTHFGSFGSGGDVNYELNQNYRLLLAAFLATLSNKEIDEMKKEWSEA